MLKIEKVRNNELKGEVALPASKSISHRYQIIQALTDNGFQIGNLSGSSDTRLLEKALHSENSHFDFEDAGTPMRFFLAYAAFRNIPATISGNESLKARPIGHLVDALKQLGCQIEYLEKEGCLPVRIDKGIDKAKDKVVIDAGVSSQFISALLLVAPGLLNGLKLELEGRMASKPYVDLTIDCMKRAGVNVIVLDNKIVVPAKKYCVTEKIEIEPDWSAATFMYALVAASRNSDISLTGLTLDSLQGDRVMAYLFEFFGVKTTIGNTGIRLTNSDGAVNRIKVDFTAMPDTFPAIAAICAMLKINATFTGIKNLALKESNRLMAMKENLEQTGANLEIENEQQASMVFTDQPNSQYHFKSHNDHRIAMACSIFALHHDIVIDDETVVNKSFPDYWKVLHDLEIIH